MKLCTPKLVVAIVLAGSFLLGSPALAERGRPQSEARGQKMLERMSQELSLTSEQQSQIKRIFESRKDEMTQMREQFKSTLTPEQREAMKNLRKNKSSARPSKEERQAKLAELGITPNQLEQMKASREKMKEQRQVIEQEIMAVLTPEQRTKFESLKASRKERRGQRGQRGQRRAR